MTRAGLAWRVCGVHGGSLSLSLCVYVCMSDLRTCAARHPRRNHPSHTRGRVGTPPSILCQFFRPVSARATRRGLCHHPHTPQRTFCSLRLTHSLPQHGSPLFVERDVCFVGWFVVFVCFCTCTVIASPSVQSQPTRTVGVRNVSTSSCVTNCRVDDWIGACVIL